MVAESRIWLMAEQPEKNPSPSPEPQPFSSSAPGPEERSVLPMVIGAGVVVLIVLAVVLFTRRNTASTAVPPTDPYLANLAISGLHMSTADNFAGGSVIYIQGTISNHGDRKLTGARVEVVFKNVLGQVSQKQVLPVSVLVPNSPYEDYGPLDRAPLQAGESRAFRVTLEHVTSDWDGQVPQVTPVAATY